MNQSLPVRRAFPIQGFNSVLRRIHPVVWGAGLLLVHTASAGGFTTLTLPTLTDDIRTWTDGSAYDPLFPSSSQTFAGVPFDFQSDANGNTVFYGGTLGSPADNTLDIPVNQFGIGTVYTLINTAFGVMGGDVGSITFNGSGGLTYTVDLIEGGNVRDHYYGGFVNTTSDPTTTEAVFGVNSPGNAHLDMQTITLPSQFSTATLTDIEFYSVGDDTYGKPFLAAATVSTVPEPAAYGTLFGLGLLAATGLRRQREIAARRNT
jgi:hypothetical protein